ncbi:MAG: hypothetical protein RLZZ241_1128 [Bacteroidota bacterium]
MTLDPSRGFLWIQNVHYPELEIYVPTPVNATGVGVVVCPGGGYYGLAYEKEGVDIAKWLNAQGIAAFVLKYRIPDLAQDPKSTYYPAQDALKAIRLVRASAEAWHIDPNKIGIMGFSAGGHLAATASTHYNDTKLYAEDSDPVSSRPDFVILGYPVITFNDPLAHKGSRTNLIGENPPDELVTYFSNELQVTSDTPPTFLVHSADDKTVHVRNSILFYEALLDKGVPAALHLYPKGGHGFGLAIKQGHEKSWLDQLALWIGELD